MSATLRAARVSALDEVPGLVHGFEQRVVTLARNEFALAIEPGGPFGPPRPPGGAEGRDETRRRVASALQPFGRLFLLKQVHGAALRRAPWSGRPEGDAAVADAPGLILGIETADCLPILIVDPVRRAVAAAHA